MAKEEVKPTELKTIEKPKAIKTKLGTSFNSLKLPTELACVYVDGGKATLPVSWAYGKYDPSVKGTVVLIGRAALPVHVQNPRHVEAKIEVTLE